MIDVGVLRAMYAAGASIESIFAAIEADQTKENSALDRRRELTAERVRRHREKACNACNALRNDVRVTNKQATETKQINGFHGDASPNGALLPFLDSLESKKERKKEGGGEKVGLHLLPKDWVPKPSHYEKVKAWHPGWSGMRIKQFVDSRLDDLQDWSWGNGQKRLDWNRVFNKFLKPKESDKPEIGLGGHQGIM